MLLVIQKQGTAGEVASGSDAAKLSKKKRSLLMFFALSVMIQVTMLLIAQLFSAFFVILLSMFMPNALSQVCLRRGQSCMV